jgi:hypothetical protein
MRWKPISPVCAAENEDQANSHEHQYAQRAMPAESSHQCNGSKSGNGHCKGPMSFLFRGEKMRRDCGDGKYNRSQQAMDHARSRCPDANLVHWNGESPVWTARTGRISKLFLRHSPYPNQIQRQGSIRCSLNSRGRSNRFPASTQRTAHSTSERYWLNSLTLPNHCEPAIEFTTTTLGTSHGPTQPLTVS